MGNGRAGTLALTTAMAAAAAALLAGPIRSLAPPANPFRLPWPVLAALRSRRRGHRPLDGRPGPQPGPAHARRGIEDQATWDALAAMGCELAQGYHLARPMPAEQATAWLAATPPGRFTMPAAERG